MDNTIKLYVDGKESKHTLKAVLSGKVVDTALSIIAEYQDNSQVDMIELLPVLMEKIKNENPDLSNDMLQARLGMELLADKNIANILLNSKDKKKKELELNRRLAPVILEKGAISHELWANEDFWIEQDVRELAKAGELFRNQIN